MAIAHVHTDATGDIASNAATTTISLPTGVSATDVVVAVFATDKGSGVVANVVTAPSGWTAVSAGFTVNDTTNNISLYAFWALGSVSNLAFTNSRTTYQQGWVCAAFSGVDNTTPVDATGATSSNTHTGSLTANAVTVATDQAWELIAFGDYNSGTVTATGFTVSENAAANAGTVLLYNTTPKGTGSTGTVAVSDTGTAGSQLLAAMPFALRPAAAADVLMGQACL